MNFSVTRCVDRFRMSKEELALLEDSEKKDKEKSEEKEKADHKKDKKKDSKKEDDKKEVKPLVFDLENSRDRVKIGRAHV